MANSYVTDAPTVARMLYRATQVFAHARCLGTPVVRAVSPEHVETKLPESSSGVQRAVDATALRFGEGDPTIEYEWLTFSQVGRKAQLLADGLRRVCTPSGVVGICGPNRASWVITDFACCFADLVTVGLHTSWPEDEVEGILQDAGVTAVVCDGSLVPRFSAVAAASGLKAIISMDELDEAACAPACVTLTTIDALVASSEEACGGPEAEPPRPFLQVASEAGDDMYTLIYASGTSGTPKAIMTPKARWKRDAAAGISRLEHKVAVSYSALAHGMDRGIVWQMVLLGGRIGFAHPDHFFASVRAIGPSLFFAMPHVWNDLYADFNARLDDALREHTCQLLEEFAASLGVEDAAESVQSALGTEQWAGVLRDRLAATSTTGLSATVAADIKSLVAERYARWALGCRLEFVGTGGAHTSAEVFNFMKTLTPGSTFEPVNSYGTTEVPGICNNGVISDDIEVKLVDVPSMNYLSTDKPWPRGEIWARSKTFMTPGYWNQPAATADAFEDGWFKTGDIGEINGEGALRIIDRKKNVEELYYRGRSVWITPGPIESMMLELDMISQICVRGDRQLGFLLALVVLSPSYVDEWLANQAGGVAREAIVRDAKVKVETVLAMRKIGEQHGLKPYEFIKGVVLQVEPWTPQNGLMTSTGKPRRSFLDARFKQALLDELKVLERAEERRKVDYSKDYLTYEFQAATPAATAQLNALWDAVKPIIIAQRAHLHAAKHKQALQARVEQTNVEFAAQEAKLRASIQASIDALKEAAAAGSDEATLEAHTSEFLAGMGTLRNMVKELQVRQAAIAAEPDEEYNAINERREKAMAALVQAASRVGEVVPPVLLSAAVLTDPSQRDRSAMSEMAAMDSWVVSCSLCGKVIEAGTTGGGVMRYHCQDLARTDIDQQCYEQFSAARQAVDGTRAIELLRSFSSAPFGLVSQEYQNQVWLRVACKAVRPWPVDDTTHRVDTSAVSPGWLAMLKKYFWDKGQEARNATMAAQGKWEQVVKPPSTGTPAKLVSEAFRAYKNRLCLGMPLPELLGDACVMPTSKLVSDVDGGLTLHDRYLWLTYHQVGELSTKIAKGLRSTLPYGAHVGICGFNCFEWSLCDFASAMAGCVVVGLHTTYSAAEMASVVDHSEVQLIFVSSRSLPLVREALDVIHQDSTKTSRVAHLVVINGDGSTSGGEEESKTSQPPAPATVASAADGAGAGFGGGAGAGAGSGADSSSLPDTCYLHEFATSDGELDDPLTMPRGGGEALFSLLYTSGSTGVPKAVMVSADQFWIDISETSFASPLVGVSYIPLSHSSDRLRVWEFLGNGGRVGFAFYDASNWAAHEHGKKEVAPESFGLDNNVAGLMRQIKPLSPLALAFPPRIWNGLYYLFQQRLADTKYFTSPEEEQPAIWEHVRADFVDIFGSRAEFIATGGAPTPPVVAAWVEKVWKGKHLVNSYGATEVGAICSDGRPMKKESWRMPVEIKLLDHPETAFLTSDKPHPRGEVLVRSILTSRGYFKNPDMTASAFDEEGFFHTGDLAMRDDQGRYHVLGRVASTHAVAGGNVVVPDQVENVYQASPFVRQVFIHTSVQHAQPVAVVVVDTAYVAGWFSRDGRALVGDVDDAVLEDATLKATVRADFIRLAEESHLAKHAHPSAVHLTSREWNPSNGLLNIHWKKARKNIVSAYQQQLRTMLAQGL